MNARSNTTDQMRNVLAIGVWENEGGAPDRDSVDEHLYEQYGRRIETDRSWTVYHVFTGVPAHTDGQTMTGLSRPNATDRMLSLNGRKDGRHKDRDSLTSRAQLVRSTTQDCLP